MSFKLENIKPTKSSAAPSMKGNKDTKFLPKDTQITHDGAVIGTLETIEADVRCDCPISNPEHSDGVGEDYAFTVRLGGGDVGVHCGGDSCGVTYIPEGAYAADVDEFPDLTKGEKSKLNALKSEVFGYHEDKTVFEEGSNIKLKDLISRVESEPKLNDKQLEKLADHIESFFAHIDEKEKMNTYPKAIRELKKTKPFKMETKTFFELSDKKIETIHLDGVPFPRSGLTMLAGYGGVGKSKITVQLAIAFLEQFKDEKILFWFTEDYEQIVRSRIESCQVDKSVLKRMVFITAEIATLDKNQVLNELKEVTKDYGMTVLDPLISFFEGEENSNSEARAFGNKLKQLNGLVMLIHHSSKGGETSRGASDFRNMVRLIYKVEEGQVLYRKGNYQRRALDMSMLGKRALLVDKDNWNVTGSTDHTAWGEDLPGYVINVFDISDKFRDNAKVGHKQANEFMDSLPGNGAVAKTNTLSIAADQFENIEKGEKNVTHRFK